MMSLDFPFISNFLKDRVLLCFGLNCSMSFVFNIDPCDIIRDGPWVKETSCVAGLAFPLYLLVLSAWKGIGTGGTRFRDRGTASVIHS